MVNRTQYDAVIVGAGAVGSALALHLSQLDYHVALLDFQTPSYATTNPERVIALSQGSAQYMQSLGVWDDIIASGVGLIKDIHAFEPDNSGYVDMSHSEINAQALGYVLEIRQVVETLHQALKNRVDFIHPAQCLSFKNYDTHSTLNIKTAQGEQRLCTSLLVGADGTHSLIRKLAGITTTGWDHNRVGIVASIGCQHDHKDWAYECFREEGPLALLPLYDGRFSLVWSVKPQHAVALMAYSDQDFLAAIQQEIGGKLCQNIGDFTSIGKRSCFPLELRVAKSFSQAGLALVGNAAHTIHPVAGQGMNLGLRDAAVLADIAQHDWAKDGLHGMMFAQTYSERRRCDTWAVAGFTEIMLEAFASPLAPMRWLRGQGLKHTQHTPSLKQHLLQHASGLGQMKGVGL